MIDIYFTTVKLEKYDVDEMIKLIRPLVKGKTNEFEGIETTIGGAEVSLKKARLSLGEPSNSYLPAITPLNNVKGGAPLMSILPPYERDGIMKTAPLPPPPAHSLTSHPYTNQYVMMKQFNQNTNGFYSSHYINHSNDSNNNNDHLNNSAAYYPLSEDMLQPSLNSGK